MVRINIIPVNLLADQHLIAEWNECFMLIGITLKDKLPLDPPKEYTLGKGHINFFSN